MPNYEGSTVDEAIQVGLQALSLSKADVEIAIIEAGKKGFLGIGKKNARVSVTPIAEQVAVKEPANTPTTATNNSDSMPNRAKPAEGKLSDEEAIAELSHYLSAVTQELDAPTEVRVDRQKDVITFHLEGDKPGLLIGKHGKVLNAFQYLAQVFVHRVAENKLTVMVNVGDYRERREATLERLARNTADKVLRTGQAVFLEPMPAFERKQIHAFLTHTPEVKTHSEGDEPFRYLVVEPAKG